jgi:Mor family transcriptional regulator
MERQNEIEEWVIYIYFSRGATIRSIAKKFKLPTVEIEGILRRKAVELETYKPLRRRKL